MSGLWWSRRAIGLHAALVVSVPGLFVLFWWQLHRALAGNELSWVYTFEWPFFAVYAVWMWWKLVHEDALPVPDTAGDAPPRRPARKWPSWRRRCRLRPPTPGRTARPPDAPAGFDPYDESEPELAAYNRYLARLHADDRTEGP